MKGMDMFCTSQASTAICLSLDQSSSCISPNTIQLGTRAIDRHNPIITDSSRFSSKHPKPQNTLKNSSSKPKGHDDLKNKASGKKITKVSEDVTNNLNYPSNPITRIIRTRRNCVRPPPPTAASSRYLLSEAAFLDDVSSDCDSAVALPPPNDDNINKPQSQCARNKPASSDQVKTYLLLSINCMYMSLCLPLMPYFTCLGFSTYLQEIELNH